MNKLNVIIVGGLLSIIFLTVPFLIYTNHEESLMKLAESGAIIILALVGFLTNQHSNDKIEKKVDQIQHNTNGALTQRLNEQTATILRSGYLTRDEPSNGSTAVGRNLPRESSYSVPEPAETTQNGFPYTDRQSDTQPPC